MFRSDYADVYERAHAFNTSIEGRALLQQRSQVERKNSEVKNDCGVGASKTRSQNALDIKAVMAAITVNLKLLVWRLGG
ncbi:transposase, partial [Cohnella xylanilytica]|uniref:transposase n=1 Tax=Cohnella xylanilytica TaxID=557555 RepID=UPI0035713F35